MAQKFVAPNTIFDSSVAFLKPISLDSTVKFDNVTLTTIDTSAEGLSQSETALATSGAVRAYVDSVAAGKNEFNELLDVSIASRVNDDLVRYNSTTSTWDNASLNDLDIATKTYVDGSLAAVDASITALFDENDVQDAQISALDASVVAINNYQDIQDASILAAGTAVQGWNGLTRTDNSIGLGGDVTQDTTIQLKGNTRNFGIETSTGYSLAMSQNGLQGGIGFGGAGGGIVSVQTTDGVNETLNFSQGGIRGFTIDSAVAGISVTDLIGQTGLRYQGNYATGGLSNYGDRWIPDYGAVKAYVDGSIGTNFVSKSGDTMTGGLAISAGGIDITSDASISGNLLVQGDQTISGDLAIAGDLTVDGSVTYINVGEVNVSDNFINLNTGMTGTPPSTLQSGLRVLRGDLEPYAFFFDETLDTFRIGISPEGAEDASTQAVATREDAPITGGVGYWNPTEFRIDTDASLVFTPTGGLVIGGPGVTINGLAADGAEATGILINASNELVTREFGTMAFETATDYATLAYVDGSIATINAYQAIQDASIAAAGTAVQGWQGLTRTDNSIGLGGIMTQDISIGLATDNDFSISTVEGTGLGVIRAAGGAFQSAALATGSSAIGVQSLAGNATVSIALSAGKQIAGSTNDEGFTINDDDTSVGLHYQSDYSSIGLSEKGDRWIPDYGAIKAYVDASVSAATPNVWNGLELTDNSIGLGGSLSQGTFVEVTTDTSLAMGSALNGQGLLINNQTGVEYTFIGNIGTQSYVGYSSIAGDTTVGMVLGSVSQISMATNLDGIVVQDGIGNTGLYYATDYSSTQQEGDRWLPDYGAVKAYVDSSIGSSTSDLDASITALFIENDVQDAQISALDASVVAINAYQDIQDASIAAAGTAVQGWNGLTRTDNSIGLGGSLNAGLTSIGIPTGGTLGIFELGNSSGLYLASLGPTFSAMILGDQADAGFAYTNNAGVVNVGMSTAAANAGGKNIVMVENASGIQVNDGDSSIGLKYEADYSSNGISTFGDRWIPDYGAVKAYVDSSIGTNFVEKTGDTMTGALSITNGGLQVGTIGSPFDTSLYSDLYVHRDLTIGGNLSIDGSLFVRSVEAIDVSSSFITLNTGQTGTPPASMQSGIVVARGDLDPYVFIYDESTESFRIGIAPVQTGPSFDDASTQAVATREDSPSANGVGFWNNSFDRIDTDASFNYTTAIGLQSSALNLTGINNDGAEATALMINGSNQVVSRELGSIAFEDTATFATVSYVDASLAARDADISAVETSITDLSTGKLDAVASTTAVSGHEVYSGEADNTAYIKRLVAGTGATLISDSSTITVSVTGAAGYMSKYTDTFDGTSGTSLSIPFGTHGITNDTSTLVISVFDGNSQVFPEISVNAGTANVTLEWTASSLTADCRYIITG